MPQYADLTVTLGTAPWVNNYSQWFPHDHECYVAVENQSQSALTISLYTEGGGLPVINVDPGQPFVSKLKYKMLVIAGASGSVFGVKIQDEPLDTGKKQQTSTSLTSVVVTNADVNTTPASILQVPAGFIAEIESIAFTSGAGGIAKCFCYAVTNVGGQGANWATPIAGQAYPGGSGASTNIGYGPGNDVVFPSIFRVLPGGNLVAYVDAGTAVVDFRYILRPL
jgi:hypothetical protein